MSRKRRSLPWEVTEERLRSGVRGRREGSYQGLDFERRNWGQSEPRKEDILV